MSTATARHIFQAAKNTPDFSDEVIRRIGIGQRHGMDHQECMFVAHVGPKEASDLLSLSKGNRNEDRWTVDSYARDMYGGKWIQENGNPISIAVDGRLLNGHHRLKAVIKAGVSIRFLISFGNPTEAIQVADGHRARTIVDRFRLKGTPMPTRTVSAVRVWMSLHDGGTPMAYSLKRTLSEVESAISMCRQDLDAMRDLINKDFNSGFWGAMLFARPIDPMTVDAMAACIVDGTGISGQAHTLRDQMLRRSSGTTVERMSLALRTLYAVRATIEGRSVKHFCVKDGSTIVNWVIGERRKVGL